MNTASLRSAKYADILRMPRDNYSHGDWCIQTDGYKTWITKQKLGERPTHEIEIPKAAFDKLCDAYVQRRKFICGN